VAFDDDLVTRTLRVVDELRATAESSRAAPPLVDSPKCPRCSLVGIGLPDESIRSLLAAIARRAGSYHGRAPADPCTSQSPVPTSVYGMVAWRSPGRASVGLAAARQLAIFSR
jgi:CRISPR-associated protein Cas1